MDSYESRFSMKLLASMMRFRQVYVNMCTFPYQYVYVYMYIQIYTYLEICIYHIYIYTTVHTFILGVYISRLHLHISNLEDILLRQSIQDGTTIPAMWRQLLFTVRRGFLGLADARSSWRIWIKSELIPSWFNTGNKSAIFQAMLVPLDFKT